MSKDNITLIGMPGVGKSTVGVVLAKVLGYRFLDSDLEIQEQTGKLLHELIEEYGGAEQVLNHPRAEYTKELLAAVPRLKRAQRRM